MTVASPRTWTPADPVRRRLRLPRWAFVAWLTYRRRLRAAPAPSLPGSIEAEIEARRLARMQRDLVPQDSDGCPINSLKTTNSRHGRPCAGHP